MTERRVTITDSLVTQMIASPKFRKEFPFLATAYLKLKAGVKSCGKCGRKRKTNQADLSALRATLASMGNNKKLKLKKMLGADQVIVAVQKGRGKVRRVKF